MDQPSALLKSSSPQLPTAAGTRRYRSKAQRPCDVCRARKVLCNIPDPSRPCQLCERIGRKCTFIGKTTRRPPGNGSLGRRESGSPPKPTSTTAAENPALRSTIDSHRDDMPQPGNCRDNVPSPGPRSIQFDQNLTIDGSAPTLTWPNQDNNGGSWGLFSDDFNGEGLAFEDSPSAFDFLPDFHDPGDIAGLFWSAQPDDSQDEASDQVRLPSITSEPLSLDRKAGHSATWIGFSNESDPFALQHFPFDDQGKVDFFRVTYRKINSSDRPPVLERPLHFLQSQEVTAHKAQKAVDDCLQNVDDRSHLEFLVDRTNGVALVLLYFRFVFPSLPIVSRSLVLQDVRKFVEEAPTGLLAGIYALALPFAAWDESLCLHNAYASPSVDALWRITHTCLQRELQFPRLSTVQTFLLLLNYLPFDSVSVENPFAWSMAASMLAMAQSLGLNADPSRWNLPAWEIRLRRRLWWSVVVEHSWRAVTHGRSSMLRDDDWDVSFLTGDDFAIAAGSPREMSLDVSPEYFIRLCSLTLIADEICRRFFSLRAVSRNESLEILVAQARGLRQQLIDWWEALPEVLQLNFDKPDESEDQEDSVENHAPLYVAYYTAHILLFRALLRPIVTPRGSNMKIHENTDKSQDTVAALLNASRSLIRTIIKFICGLDARQQSAFWPAYTRHCLCYPGLFSYMLALQRSEAHMLAHDRNLLAIWRKTLRARVQSWPLLRFALVKIDAIYWKGVQKPSS